MYLVTGCHARQPNVALDFVSMSRKMVVVVVVCIIVIFRFTAACLLSWVKFILISTNCLDGKNVSEITVPIFCAKCYEKT